MKPYYQDEFTQLFLGDCLEVAEWLAADVLVTDPPYGDGYTRHDQRFATPIANDHSIEVRDAALEAWGEGKPWACFGSWRQPRPRGTTQVLIWDKEPGNGPGKGDIESSFGTSHEEIALGGRWLRPAGMKRRGSVIATKYQTLALVSATGHPTPKPTSLMETLIAYAPAGVIADPFAGCGPTLIAAKLLGRKAIGVEIEERFCEQASLRLSQDAFDFSGASA